VIHDRKYRAEILNKVDLGKGSRKLGAVVLPVVQLERDGFLIDVRGPEHFIFNLIRSAGGLSATSSVVIARCMQ
jgi:hypothetical protein